MKEEKTFSDWLFNKTGLSFWCDWLQFPVFDFNWISLHLINFYLEWDRMGNELEVSIGLIGFNMRWQLSLDRWMTTKEYEGLKKRIKECTKSLEEE